MHYTNVQIEPISYLLVMGVGAYIFCYSKVHYINEKQEDLQIQFNYKFNSIELFKRIPFSTFLKN